VYFFPSRVDEDYWTWLDIFFSGNVGRPTRVVPVHARVRPEPGRRRDRLGISGEQLEFIYDLVGESLCLPYNANICRVSPYFEPVREPGVHLISDILVGGAPVDAELSLRDADGAELVRDVSGRSRRRHSVEYLPPNGGGDFRGNPCIAELVGLRPGYEGFVRVNVRGLVLTPGSVLDGVKGAIAAAARDGRVFLATDAGLEVVEWSDPSAPKRVGETELSGLRGLALGGHSLFAAVGEEIVLLDVSRPTRPAARASAKLDTPARALATHDRFVYAAGDDHVVTFEVDGKALRQRDRCAVPPGARWLICTGDGLLVVGPDSLALLALDEPSRPRPVVTGKPPATPDLASRRGPFVMLHSGDTSHLVAAQNGQILPVATFARRHWSAEFLAGDDDRLYAITPDGQAATWRIVQHRLDRSKFKEALHLRYAPPRPRGGARRSRQTVISPPGEA
jgi:hypothetical protein